jgi:hypothetical protein
MMTVTMAMTMATMGRLMKNEAMRAYGLDGGAGAEFVDGGGVSDT